MTQDRVMYSALAMLATLVTSRSTMLLDSRALESSKALEIKVSCTPSLRLVRCSLHVGHRVRVPVLVNTPPAKHHVKPSSRGSSVCRDISVQSPKRLRACPFR
ncbi:hypothetical protein B0T25DRAFT_527442 [Lasiosphaeria hispida]|uniref:Uncharacterized protein n=1 Tax=Lasiosphaeria hispida TaxID=260671 RepID=A0AAJ0MKC6_9PEZI|nr:hypothetical protein B0T25DRAFT_527442 [Lasiosphaeria hispida]